MGILMICVLLLLQVVEHWSDLVNVTPADLRRVAKLFKSDMSKLYPSDSQILQHHSDFVSRLFGHSASSSSSAASPHVEKSQSIPWVVQLNIHHGEKVSLSSFDELASVFGMHNINHLDPDYILIHAPMKTIQAYQDEKGDSSLINKYIPLLPDMKIDSSLRSWLDMHSEQSSCFDRHTTYNNSYRPNDDPARAWIEHRGRYIRLRLVLAPMSDSETADLLTHLDRVVLSSSSNTGSIVYEYSRPPTGSAVTPIVEKHTYLEITFSSCEHVLETALLLAQRHEVQWIERLHPSYTHNRSGRGICETGKRLNSPMDSSMGIRGDGEVIGVVDTGIDMQSCFFADTADHPVPYVLVGSSALPTALPTSTPGISSSSHRKIAAYYYQTKTDKLEDCTGHGTHTAGTVAGRVADDFGSYHSWRGVSSDAKIAFFDVGLTSGVKCDESKESSAGLTFPANLNTGMFSVMYNGAGAPRIFSNSWGTNTNAYDSYSVQTDLFMFNNPDSLVVFAAGNKGTGGVASSLTSPSTAKNVLTVGASFNDHTEWLGYEYSQDIVSADDDSRDGIKTLAGFSSRGPTEDKRLKPDVVAPGCAVTSAKGFETSTSSSSADAHCDVQPLIGTSMACPMAAALASKVRQYFKQGYYPRGKAVSSDGFTPSGALIKAILVHSGQPLTYIKEDITVSTYSSSIKYPDTNQGYGRIQLNAVLNFGNDATLNPINLFVVGASDPKSSNYQSITYSNFVKKVPYIVKFSTSSDATVVNQTPIRVTLVYTDYPAIASSTVILINKLVLTCSSDDKPYYSTGSISSANVQVIDIMKPTVATTYTVTVTATFLSTSALTPNKDQPFALVITGANQYLPDDFEPSATSGYVSSADTSSSSSDFTASTSAMPFVIALTIAAAILIPMAMLAGYLAMQSYKGEEGIDDDEEDDEGDESGRVRRPRSIFGCLVLLSQRSGTQSNARSQQNSNVRSTL